MKDKSRYKAGRRFDPMFILSAFFAASAKHLCNVLSVGHFAECADAHFGKRIESRAIFFDWSEAKADVARANAVTGGSVPVFSFDVEDYRALFPCEQRWNN